uniref:Uncharacterized protein n=1 Tax=Brassica oleracea var. oleracea TaxID=109376 RepID=A0A0D3AL12_BRAOL
IDAEIQRDEEIVDVDGEDIGARDGVGTGELESGFGRITTSNPSPGRERLMGESRSAALKAVEETRTEKLLLIWIQSQTSKSWREASSVCSTFVQWEALALLLIGISVNQLCSLPEGSHVDVRQRNKCHGWTSGYGRLSFNAKPSLNAENWHLVIVVSDEV